MRKHLPIALAGAALLAGATAGTVQAAPGAKGPRGGDARNLPGFVKKWEGEKQTAADQVARGAAKPNGKGVVKLKNGKYVQHSLETTEQMTIALVDFSDLKHNSIPEPDRSVDNSTYWTPDFTVQHYRDMLFAPGGGSYGKPSLRDFYQELSSGRFSWDGQVSNWTTLAGTQADYGANKAADGDDSANGPVSRVVKATLDGLTARATTAASTSPRPTRPDRYDCDGDGNFNEPDGYIDHFQMVHAGEGEDADGGPQATRSGATAPTPTQRRRGPDGAANKGGYQLGNTGLWVGDYTIEAENGGMGVFAHEFGHDLGLPDYYDTNGGENSTGFWSLMSSGSWGSYAEDPSIGTTPMHMDAYAKQYLGWLDLAQANAGDKRSVQPRPGGARHQGRLPGAWRSTCRPTSGRSRRSRRTGPTRTTCTPTRATAWTTAPSDAGSPLTADTPVSMRANWDIEQDWDYAYLDTRSAARGSTCDLRLDHREPERPELRPGDHGHLGRLADGHGHAAGGHDGLPPALLDRRRGQRRGPRGRRGEVRLHHRSDGRPTSSTLGGWRKVTGGSTPRRTTTGTWRSRARRSCRTARSAGPTSSRRPPGWRSTATPRACCSGTATRAWPTTTRTSTSEPGRDPPDRQPPGAHDHAGRQRKVWSGRWQAWDAPFSVDRQQITLVQAGVGSKTYTADPVTTFWDSSPTAYYNPQIPANSVKTAGSGRAGCGSSKASKDRTSYTVKLDSKK